MTTTARKIFLAGPFKALVNSDGIMQTNFKQRFIDLIAFFEARGFEVHNAHQRESWGKSFMTPEECTKIDFDEISACDYFVAFPGSPASPGTHIEIGWASALQKPLILLLEAGKEYAFLVRGLHTVANVEAIVFEVEDDYLRELERLFPAPQ